VAPKNEQTEKKPNVRLWVFFLISFCNFTTRFKDDGAVVVDLLLSKSTFSPLSPGFFFANIGIFYKKFFNIIFISLGKHSILVSKTY